SNIGKLPWSEKALRGLDFGRTRDRLLVPAQRLGRRRRDLPLDHAPHARRLGADVQRTQALDDRCIALGRALTLTYVVEPRRGLEARDPQLGLREIAKQLPAPRAVAPADASALGDQRQELEDIALADPV